MPISETTKTPRLCWRLRSRCVFVVGSCARPFLSQSRCASYFQLSLLLTPPLPSSSQTTAQTIDESIKRTCKIDEDGKAHCCYSACGKKFRGVDFLKKHIKGKHELFAADGLLRDAEPCLRARFEKLDIVDRPLPLVDVEENGLTRTKAVSDVMREISGGRGGKRGDRGGGAGYGAGGDRGNNGRGGGRGQGGRYDDGDRRLSGGRGGGRDRERPAAQDPAGRTMSSYMDVDAPKASAPAAIDYGVSVLPPAKKRKVVLKKAE